MSDKNSVGNFNVVNITAFKQVLKLHIQANEPIHIIGPPGIGKTTIVGAVGAELDMEVHPLILSLCDPTDIGGFPFAGDNEMLRMPLGAIKALSKRPGVLFLDELSTSAPPVQAASLRLIYERVAGDVQLHPGTRIIAASNPPDQAAGGNELTLPLLGRMTNLHLHPDISEIQDFFFNLGASDSTLRRLGVDFGATLERSPDLVRIDPPAGTMTTGTPYGSPRSWHRALKLWATAIESGVNVEKEEDEKIIKALLSGNIGEWSTSAYLKILKLRENLPSIKDIIANPASARLPHDLDTHVAMFGVVAQVASQDTPAAYVYSARINDEFRVGLASILSRFNMREHKKSRHFEAGIKAQEELIKTIGKVLKGDSI